MEVYLTFDDGVQAGTEEVLDVLQETGVRATFFLIGNELRYAYKKSQSKLLALLTHMYDRHDIGNHSYSHTNFYYSNYYSNNGVQIDREGTRRSITADFEKCRAQLNAYLQLALGNSYKEPGVRIARLPGRNTYYVFQRFDDRAGGNGDGFFCCEKGTEAIAKELHACGYNIFGWDVEWEMSFEFHTDSVNQKKIKESTGGIDYQVEEDVYPCLDMHCGENSKKDRLIEDWPGVVKKIKAKAETSDKIILLMHDRAFRSGEDRNESDKLRSLINELKMMKVTFKGLSEYYP